MTEVDERIARLRALLSAPDADGDSAVIACTLRQLEQLRAEMLDAHVG